MWQILGHASCGDAVTKLHRCMHSAEPCNWELYLNRRQNTGTRAGPCRPAGHCQEPWLCPDQRPQALCLRMHPLLLPDPARKQNNSRQTSGIFRRVQLPSFTSPDPSMVGVQSPRSTVDCIQASTVKECAFHIPWQKYFPGLTTTFWSAAWQICHLIKKLHPHHLPK